MRDTRKTRNMEQGWDCGEIVERKGGIGEATSYKMQLRENDEARRGARVKFN